MISFKGFRQSFLTFLTDDTVTANAPVKFADGKAVELCVDGDEICGVVNSVSNGAASVQLAGYVELPCEDDAVTVGYVSLCADANGGVKKGEGRKFLVLNVNTTDKKCGFIL